MHSPINASSSSYYASNRHVRLPTSHWRRKWLIVGFLVCVVTLVLFFTRPYFIKKVHVERDTYLDDVPEELYKDVLHQWYEVTDLQKLYNRDDIPADDPVLLKDLRDKWLIWKHDSNKSYFLQEANVEEQSMGQAQVIREIFQDKRNGFFIECGAYDGETRSNTLTLERDYGWSGLLIEADPINFTKMLQKNRRAYLSPTCLSVQPHPMLVSFLMARNVGRIHDPADMPKETPENPFDVAYNGDHILVQCFPLIAYLNALNVTTVDYFSLDIEGNEIDVLETIPFHLLDIKTLSVEYIHNAKGREYMVELMEARGYSVYRTVDRDDNLAHDIIFVQRDM